MLITLSRSGGFTGIPMKKIVDTKKLPPEQAEKIEELVFTSEFFTVKCKENEKTSMSKPDQFTYHITVADEVTEQTREIPERKLSDTMKALITLLEEIKG